MEIIKLNCGWYEHDDGEFKPCGAGLENKISKVENCFLVPVKNSEINGDYAGFSLNADYRETILELFSLNMERELDKWETEELFQNYELISYRTEEREVAFFENEKEFSESKWNGPYVILSELEKVGNFKTVNTIKEHSYYAENQLYNISRIKFSEDFEEVIEVYEKNNEMDELWFETKEEKEDVFKNVKKELIDLGISDEEMENISSETEIDLSLLGDKFSLINELTK